jgi:hypothetical protein
VNVLKQAKQRAEQSWRCSMCNCVIDDDDRTGLWARKRARQARSRELVRMGQRSQESMFFIAAELVREMKVTHRA